MSNKVKGRAQLFNFVSRLVNSFLLRLSGYVDTDGVKLFKQGNGGICFKAETENKLPLISIVGRTLYSEYHKSYPIADLRELKQVLKQLHSDRMAIHLISQEVNHQRQVMSFVFSPKLNNNLPTLCFLLPESLVAYAGLKEEILQAEFYGKWFLYKNDKFFSSQLVSSLCSNLQTFGLIHGIPETTSTASFTESDTPSFLFQSVKKLNTSQMVSAFRFALPERKAIPWKPLMFIGVGALTLYFSFISLYLAVVYPDREEQVRQLSDQVQSALSTQEKYDLTYEQLDVVYSELNRQRSVFPVWLVLKHLAGLDVDLQSSELTGDELVVNGRAENAIQILSAISDLSIVKSASFSQPTRRSRNQEVFSIRIAFKPEAWNAQ